MRIVVTGATAGFGEIAARKWIAAGHQVTIGARDPGKAKAQFQGKAECLSLDLDALSSVRAFTGNLGPGQIDALVLNAGLQLAKPAKSADGFERTFAVNHLAHYLLLRKVSDRLAPGARVILTGSGTHDPEEGTPVTPPKHANAEWLAYPERDPHREASERARQFRAYSSSKLCNIMTARHFAVLHPGFSVMAFDPAYVPGTKLGRDNPAPIAWLAGKIIPMMMPKDRSSTVPASGACLADLVLNDRYAACRGDYWAVRGQKLARLEPSALARDAAAAEKLWDDSAALVGL
jgi:NAD(P)-dependent dehydrogenase (short-subunit alcohol dehydrogenase family)